MPVALLLMMTVPMLLVSDLDQETLAESYLSTASYQIVAALVIVGLLGVEAFTIIYMYRWTTTYNLREFGFRSKKEWKNQSIGDSGP